MNMRFSLDQWGNDEFRGCFQWRSFLVLLNTPWKILLPKKLEGLLNIYINLSCLVYISLHFRTDPDTSNLWGWILWPKAQRLEGFKTSPCPSPSLEMGQLWALRKQAHSVLQLTAVQLQGLASVFRFLFPKSIYFKGETLGRRERSHKKQMTNCKRQQLDSACSANTHLIKSIFFSSLQAISFINIEQ